MSKKKILYITPHLSTGGLPQYLYKQIENFKNQFEIYVVEWEDITGGVLVVSKNKIKSILPKDRLFVLDSNKNDILSIIKKIQPDFIHFQEIPETFVSKDILENIYVDERKYSIIVTTHSSYTEPNDLEYLADEFVLVSKWSQNKFKNHFKNKIPCDIWEYPIDNIEYNKEEFKKKLNFDPKYKHVLNIGLFTPGKNQKEIIELARLCLGYKIKFHFVGNQADNFKDYWEPLMKNLPPNCVWHGEKDNVEDYYKASDLFYFPSLWELNPLVLKEALSCNLPIFLRKLHTYEDTYDNKVTYLTNNIENNKKLLIDFFGLGKKFKITALHILTDIDTPREVKSMQSLTKLKDYGIDYKPIISKRYTELPPSETCEYPEKISLTPGGKLTPGHYGCYLGHKKAFYEGMYTNSEFILIFEADCAIDIPYEEFIEKLDLACDLLNKKDLLMFSLGFHNNTNIIEKKSNYWVVDKFYGAHAYLIPRKSYNILQEMYEYSKWNVTDLLFAEKLNQYKIGIFSKPITKQLAGVSILDQKHNEERY
jgi:GR25 family glycosyltransferase involved in LPS biosynthesis